MKRKVTLLSLCIVAMVVMLTFVSPITAHADLGPKPSINITFDNLSDETLYATVLSQNITTGPYSAYAPDEGWDYKNLGMYDSNYNDNPDYHNEQLERIWQTFVDYEDAADGYYFLQRWWEIGGDNNKVIWSYYPPYSFKLLLFNPTNGVFVSSGIYERYAFDSYYTVDMTNVNELLLNPDTNGGAARPTPSDDIRIELVTSYDYTWEIISLLCRIVLTIGIEMLVALIFRIKGRKALLTILITNVVTQIALNVALNVLVYLEGFMMLIFLYLPLELGVLFVEAVTYSIALHKQGVPVWKSLLYALVANVASGGLGFVLAWFVPGLL